MKITLVPEFGGRIISMIYKPTGHEELYQNPAGAPYGVGQDWFYYKWLMVYGGIFPTLPEPEHGKAWLLPRKYTVLKQTPDTVRCQMSWEDTIKLQGINTNKWRYGETILRCDFTVTLIKGASSLEADVALYNDSNKNLDYEYWTCLTLAPGSEPGDPKCTQGAELIIISLPTSSSRSDPFGIGSAVPSKLFFALMTPSSNHSSRQYTPQVLRNFSSWSIASVSACQQSLL